MSSDGHFRAHGRRQVDLPATLQKPPLEGSQPIRIVNLSLAGACIETSERYSKGTWVMLEIVAPTLWDPLMLRGRVVWTSESPDAPSLSGLQFEHHEAGHAFALYELISAQDYSM
jgi:hypothetical protein